MMGKSEIGSEGGDAANPGSEQDPDGDDLLFLEDEFAPASVAFLESEPWKIMVVDDEDEVHQVTRLVLGGYQYQQRRLVFINAYSAREARAMLGEHPDIAVILLDVVMETDTAGLDLVRHIREEAKNPFVRIILRTGQPGIAPERRVTLEYDINDYVDKSELTADRLTVTTTTSLRGFEQLIRLEESRRIIEANKRGLEKIVQATSSIFELRSLQEFAHVVLMQLESLLGLNIQSIYSLPDGFSAVGDPGAMRILAGTGRFSDQRGELAESTMSPEDFDKVRTVFNTRRNLLNEEECVCFVENSSGARNVLYVRHPNTILTDVDRRLVELFNQNIAAAFENIHLNSELDYSQREIIYTLGEVTEARSEETGFHVKRVGEYSRLMARKLGLSKDQQDLVQVAAPLHDVGKVGIPDEILNKATRLSPTEFEVMKSHTALGYRMLRASKRKILQAGAVIAHEHHERFDGGGYPRGLAGENIHVLARITSIADVFDALTSDRVYRKAIHPDRLQAYFVAQRGVAFDPVMVDLFLDGLDEFLQIKREFADAKRQEP